MSKLQNKNDQLCSEETKDFSLDIDLKALSDEGVFSGYASTFGGAPDSYGDVIARGAFKNSLSKNGHDGRGVRMLYQHDVTKPIGIWESIVENNRGLKVVGKLALDTTLGKDVYGLMRIGAISMMSIGFNVVDFDIEDTSKNRKRILNEIDLWEISLVTFAANNSATVTSVKDMRHIKDVRALEKYLCDVGFSKQASKYIIHVSKNGCEAQKRKVDELFTAIGQTKSILETLRTKGVM